MDSHTLDATSDAVVPSTDTIIPRELAVPRPMRMADISNAIYSMELAFAEDPLHHWLRDTQDFHESPLYYQSRRAEWYTMWTQFVAKGWAFTVDDGDAAVGYFPAKNTWSMFDKGITLAIGGILNLRYMFTFTRQQKERGREFIKKHKQALEEALGDRKDDMVYLHILCTKPAKQGHGYASALARQVTKIADEQRRSTYLLSSNTANTGFYNSVGFVEKARLVVGVDDPTWKEDPVVVLVMVRELPDSV